MHLPPRYFGSLFLAVCSVSCEQALPAEQSPPLVPTVTALLYPSLSPPASKVMGAPWRSNAPPSIVPELEGSPITMAVGAHCKTFRHLPSTHYTVSTLVRDACIEIPNDTTVAVREGATLAIVATNGLLVGRNVTFAAKGTGGLRGDRAEFASVSWSPRTDAEIRAVCTDHGNQCRCPSDESSLASIRGHAGHAGTAGGSLSLVVGELISPSKLSGFSIDVSGGPGGPPGDSGAEECVRGQLRCLSPACSAGILAGANGMDGEVFLSLGGTKSDVSMDRMRAATVPTGVTRTAAADGITNFADGAALVDQAIHEGWERRSGTDEY
jgi:hypothetical protein